ncbi:hypothetical protein EC988_001017 [Linderina pennispora]|nr:hypothetical protein EC988_001017 [Linderina pennispora]
MTNANEVKSMPGLVNTIGKEHASQTGATIDQYGNSLNIIPVGTPTRDELESYNFERLKYYYAMQASINRGLPFGSVPPAMSSIRKHSRESHPPIEHFMSVVDYQGILQGFIAGLIKAKRILEIGTFIGISAIFHANALKRNGVKGGADETGHKPIVSFEISEEYAAKARANIIEAGVDEYIEIIVGDANKLLAQLEGVTFDIVFLDADKISYKGYYETVMDRGLLNKDGLIIVDNTAFESVVAYADAPVPVADDYKPLGIFAKTDYMSKEWAVALHEFNEHIRNDPRVEVVMIPLFTGITLVRFIN